MGANCCTSAKEQLPPNETRIEVSAHRNARHSPSWSFRWDNRTYIEDIMDSHAHVSPLNSRTAPLEAKMRGVQETEGLYDGIYGGSPSDAIKRQPPREAQINLNSPYQCDGSTSSPEIKEVCEPSVPENAALLHDLSKSVPSTSSSELKAEPMPAQCSQISDVDLLGKAGCSPGCELLQPVSNSKISSPKSLPENNSLKGRQSFSISSNELSVGGSQCGSSDGWSMRTFSELVASSRRERFSVNHELLGSASSKMAISEPFECIKLSPQQQVCKICSKSWNSRALPDVAVLVCGHVYHADCLDNVTAAADKYDPRCPVCTKREKLSSSLFGKIQAKLRSKASNNVAAEDSDGSMSVKSQMSSEKGFQIAWSSGTRRLSDFWPLFRRRSSTGERQSLILLEEEAGKRKKRSSL